jgi:hypothetical protein
MFYRSVVARDPSGGPGSGLHFLVSSSPTVVGENLYVCIARVRLALAAPSSVNYWVLTASTLEVRVAQIPSIFPAPWSEMSADVYPIVADAFLNAWGCGFSASIRTSSNDAGPSIGVRRVLAAAFHSHELFRVPVQLHPGPGDESDQTVSMSCRAVPSPGTPAIFAYAVSVNHTHATCNVVLFQHRQGQGSVIITVQDSGGNLYGGSNESVVSLPIVVIPSNSPPSFSFRSISPCSYVGNVGNVTVNMSTDSVPVILENFIVGLTAGRNEDADQSITLTVVLTSGQRLLSNSPYFFQGRSLVLPLVPFLFGRLTLVITATDNGPGFLSTSRALDITILNVNKPPFFESLSSLIFRRSPQVSNYTANISVCPGPGDERHSQTASANFSGDLVSGFKNLQMISASGCSIYQLFLSIPGGLFGNTSLVYGMAIDNHGSVGTAFMNISILYVNSKPSFRIDETHFSLPQSVLPHTIPVVLQDVSVGAFDDGQAMQCYLRDVNTSFFPVEPVLTLVTPEFNFKIILKTASLYTTGLTHFNVVCTDNGGTENRGDDTFSIPIFLNYTLINLPPFFNIMSRSINAKQDSLLQTLPGFIYNISAGQPAEFLDLLQFSIVSDNPLLFEQLQIHWDFGTSSATFLFKPAAYLFGNANLTITLKEIELKSNQQGTLNLLESQATFPIFILPNRPFPDFNISNSTIELAEDFGEVNFPRFIPQIYFGSGESNDEKPVFFEFSITSVLDTSKPHSTATTGQPWTPVFMHVNNLGDLRIVSETNQWGTLIVHILLTDLFVSKGSNYSSPIRSFKLIISPVNDPPVFHFGGAEIIIPDNVSSFVAIGALRNISVGPPDEVSAPQYIQSIQCSVATSPLSILSAVVPSCVGSSICESASISFSLIRYTSGSANMSCCVFDTANSFTCQVILVKILSDFHLLPKGDIRIGPSSKDDLSNVTVFSHVRITLPEDPNFPDVSMNINNVEISFIVSNMPLFFALPSCVINETSCNIVFIPTPQKFGESVVQIFARHNTRTTSAFFNIEIGRVNQSPNFTLAFPSVSVLSSSGATSIPDFALNVTAGPFDSDQSTFFVVQAKNTTLVLSAFSELPRISSLGVLTFVVKPNVYGRYEFSCTLVDSPSSSLAALNTTLYFSIVVVFVNQAPSFNYERNTTITFTSDNLFFKNSFLKNVSAGSPSENWQKVFCKLEPMADYSRSFVVSPFISIFGSEGTLFLQLAPGRHGTFQFMMGCKDDGGVADGGQNAAQSVVVSFIAPFINYPPTLDIISKNIYFNSSATTSFVSAQVVSIPSSSSFCVPHVFSTVQLKLNSSSFVDTSTYFVNSNAARLPTDRLYKIRGIVSYKPPQLDSTNFEYIYAAGSSGEISVWVVANVSEPKSTATQIFQLQDGSITGFQSQSSLQQAPMGLCGISSWTANGDVYSFISAGCDDLRTRPQSVPVTSALIVFTSWIFDPKYSIMDSSGARLLRPSGGLLNSNGRLMSQCSEPSYYGSTPLMYCSNSGSQVALISGALQIVSDVSSENFPAIFSLEVTFSSYSIGSPRIIVSATSPISSIQRGFYLAITAVNLVEFGIVNEHFADSSGEYGRYSVLVSNQTVYDGQLTHLVATYDGKFMYLYMNGIMIGFQAACMFPPCGRVMFSSPGEPAIPLIIGRSPMNAWFHSFSIYSNALQLVDVSSLFQQKTGPIAQVLTPAYGMALRDGRLGNIVLGGQNTISLHVSGRTFSQIRYTIICSRGNLNGSCSVGLMNSSGVSLVSCPQPQNWEFGTSVDCAFNLIGTSDVSDSFVFASRAPLYVTLITPSYVRKYAHDLSGFVDSQTLIDATGCAASVVVLFGSRRFIFTARTWSGSADVDTVSSPVFEILGTSVVEVVSMRLAVPRAVDVAAVEFNGGLYVAFASELPTSSVFVYHSGTMASPTLINVAVGQSARFSSLFASMNFLYAMFCSVGTVFSLCNVYNIQENSAYIIQTISSPLSISEADIFAVSSGQIFLFLAPKFYVWNSLSRSFALHSDLGSDITNAKLARIGSSDLLVTFSPNMTSVTNPVGSVAPPSTETTSPVSSLASNPPQRTFLASQGVLRGTCYMRVGALEADLLDSSKTYSAVPSSGNVDTLNVVFASTLIFSSSNSSVYRFFAKGSNRPLTGAAVNPEYFSNSFGGQWSDASVSMDESVNNSTRISGRWGGSGTDHTALLKIFDKSYLVELGWVMLDISKQFDSTIRNDTAYLTWPFDPTWSSPVSGAEIAPYRCYYKLPSSASTAGSSSSLGLLKFHLFDPVSMDFILMPYQYGQSVAMSSSNVSLLAVWAAGSNIVASIGGFGTSLLLKSFSFSLITNGLADFVGMQTCKPNVGFASLFMLSADLKYVLSWYELAQNGALKHVQTLQSDGVRMVNCRAFSVQCETRIVVLACNDGIFVFQFSQEQRSLVPGNPLLAKDSDLFYTYLSSITSLSVVSLSGSLPIIVAASHSKGFLCSIGLVLQNSVVHLSGVIDFKMDGLANYFRWISQPSATNDLPQLHGLLPSKNVLHTDSYSFSVDDVIFLVTFSRCTSSVTSPASLYAMNNMSKSWVSLGILPASDGACSANFCDGGIGQRFLAVGVNHLNPLNYVQSSHIYQQSSVSTSVEFSVGGISSLFSYFPWVNSFSSSTKGARDVISVKAPNCVFIMHQEGDGIDSGPFRALLFRNINDAWASSESNLYIAKSGPISISSSTLPAPTLTEPVTTRLSSLSSNSSFFSALNSIVGLMIFGLSYSDPEALHPVLVAQELWLVNCTSVTLFQPLRASEVVVSVSCPDTSHVFLLKMNGSGTFGLTHIGTYPASFHSSINERCSPDGLSCTTYLAFLSFKGVGLYTIKNSALSSMNPLPVIGVYGPELSLASSSYLVDSVTNAFQSAPQSSWKISSVLRTDGILFAVFDDSLNSEFLIFDAQSDPLSIRGMTALSASFLAPDNTTVFGALSASPPRVSLFQLSSNGRLLLKSFVPASLSRFLTAKELAVSFDIGSSLLKIDVSNVACDVEKDQNVQMSVSASPSLAGLMSAPSVNPLGIFSATLKNFSTGSGSLFITATDSLGASSSATINVVVDSFSPPLLTVLSPSVTVFVSGLGKQTVFSVLSSARPLEAPVAFVVLNVTNPSMFSILPLFTSSGHLICGTTATESVSEVTVVSRYFMASRVQQSVPATIRVFFRLVNRPPVPIVRKQVTLALNSGPVNIFQVVSCNMSADGKDVGQVLLRYNFVSIEEQTDSTRQPVLPSRISALPSLSVDGTLSLSFATGVFGNFSIYFTATDSGGVASGGVDTSPPFSINILVQSPSDVPVFALPNNAQSINVQQNSGFNSARFLVSPGLMKRGSSTIVKVNATIASSAPLEIVSSVTAGVDGTLNFTVKSGVFGSAVVKLVAIDSDNLSGSATFVVNILNTGNIRPSIVAVPIVALTQNPTASYVVPNFVLSTSVGNDAFEQANQVITSIDVSVDAASTAPGYFLMTPTVNPEARFLLMNTRPGVFGRFVLKVTATDSGYTDNISPVVTVEGFIFAAPVILKVVPDMLSPSGGDMITVNGMHFGS